jgi:hypothetical protein
LEVVSSRVEVVVPVAREIRGEVEVGNFYGEGVEIGTFLGIR